MKTNYFFMSFSYLLFRLQIYTLFSFSKAFFEKK